MLQNDQSLTFGSPLQENFAMSVTKMKKKSPSGVISVYSYTEVTSLFVSL